ncbi:hypothetical protein IF1G_11176 [Cordyceps javanica]|uniref:CID domain-containing protein n=1 Tax=Cordyceps javanica TaxID=43265 RepID=A0A545UL46_9HYPO|nr:hypothetical protein IF1G_11176 [Cordyceps javanica]
MASAVTHLEYGLKSDLESMLSRKAPGASRSRINRLTTLCVANVEVPVLIPLLHAHFRKTPDTHKLSVLYVIDSVVRAWLLQARARNQDVSRPAPDGTHVAAVRRVTDLLPGLMRDMIQCAPDDQKVRTHNPCCYPFAYNVLGTAVLIFCVGEDYQASGHLEDGKDISRRESKNLEARPHRSTAHGRALCAVYGGSV